MNNKKNIQYDILDLTKFILSIMVVAIHTKIFPKILYPWLRLAIPLFFIISGFLFFTKINNSNNEDTRKIIKSFVLRQLKLYLFWFIALLPITIDFRENWFNGTTSLLTIFKESLFSNTFIASWFIVALVMGVLIVFYLSKKVNYKILLPIFILINIMCCFVSSYYPLFNNISFIHKVSNAYSIIFPSPVFSFPVALIYIIIGKLFADGVINIKSHSIKTMIIYAIISSILLYIEFKYVVHLTNIYYADCYIFLIPTSTIIFYLLLNIKINIKNALMLRKISTITFPLHASLAWYFENKLYYYIPNKDTLHILVFLMTLSFTYLFCFLVFTLEDKKYFNFLKYSH